METLYEIKKNEDLYEIIDDKNAKFIIKAGDLGYSKAFMEALDFLHKSRNYYIVCKKCFNNKNCLAEVNKQGSSKGGPRL